MAEEETAEWCVPESVQPRRTPGLARLDELRHDDGAPPEAQGLRARPEERPERVEEGTPEHVAHVQHDDLGHAAPARTEPEHDQDGHTRQDARAAAPRRRHI